MQVNPATAKHRAEHEGTMFAVLAMRLSSVSVVSNALRLRRVPV
jgi:cation transport ATPase